MNYSAFLDRKSQLGGFHGFEPVYLPDSMFDFQRLLTEWIIRKGRGAIFADCGLGKTLMELVWADNVVRSTNRPVLIATPLAVGHQMLAEAAKFGVEAVRSRDGSMKPGARIVITNYEQLEKFQPSQFAGMACDESSILKNFDGVRRAQVQEFMRTLPYRMLATATAAPNDYIELGTSSEALGELGHMDMLSRFFRNDQGNSNTHIAWRGHRDRGAQSAWRFKGHAQTAFWRWVCSWARAIRKPSDIGCADGAFVLPALEEIEHCVSTSSPAPGMLIDLPAVGLDEQRAERRRTLGERCARAAELVQGHEQSLVWCNLNPEGDLLEKIIPNAVQVSGSDSDEAKEERLLAFAAGEIRTLITKPKIGAWGLNFQNCAHTVVFPTHSYEQYYQGVRRFWRFGQKRPVRVDLVSSKGDQGVLENLKRKAKQADGMFSALVREMNQATSIARTEYTPKTTEVPTWVR